jgi:hypothetical protein
MKLIAAENWYKSLERQRAIWINGADGRVTRGISNTLNGITEAVKASISRDLLRHLLPFQSWFASGASSGVDSATPKRKSAILANVFQAGQEIKKRALPYARCLYRK